MNSLKEVDFKAVQLFLKIAFKEINLGNCKFIADRFVYVDGKRMKAKQALIDLNILNTKQLWDYILRLSPSECIKIDRDRDLYRDFNDDVYIFLTTINGIRTYIKLTINQFGVVCLSFHKSNFRGGKDGK